MFTQMVEGELPRTQDERLMSEEFDAAIEADRGVSEPAMIVDVEGFEGPLDLLLMLARQQKVDLAKISILALADQYLTFIEEARKLRLELAADYLVMAAWLAYLKSRLLLPEAPSGEGPSAEDMALALAYRLRRLEAFREVAGQLMDRPQLGRDVFARGAPEPIAEIKQPEWSATLYDLLTRLRAAALSAARSRTCASRSATVWSLAEARSALERLIGQVDRLVAARPVPDLVCGRAGAGADRVRLVLCLRARTGARGRWPRSIRRSRSRRSTCASVSARTELCPRMTRKKTPKETAMPSVAKKLAIVPNDEPPPLAERKRRAPKRGRKSCACWRRCCLPPASRSTRRRWRGIAGRRRTQRRAWRGCRRNTPRAASTWCASARSGPSAPPTISPGC